MLDCREGGHACIPSELVWLSDTNVVVKMGVASVAPGAEGTVLDARINALCELYDVNKDGKCARFGPMRPAPCRVAAAVVVALRGESAHGTRDPREVRAVLLAWCSRPICALLVADGVSEVKLIVKDLLREKAESQAVGRLSFSPSKLRGKGNMEAPV